MTKKEYQNLRVGSKVQMTYNDISFKTTPPTTTKVTQKGVVERFNFGGSQCFIKWENNTEQWHGRLSIDMCQVVDLDNDL